jgi:transcriptional regulator with XRE-family HTH domain
VPLKAEINTAWFLARLADLGLSQRELARRIALDHAALNLMLHGKRTMYIDEAASLSFHLRVPIETLIAQATGIPESVLHGPGSADPPSS